MFVAALVVSLSLGQADGGDVAGEPDASVPVVERVFHQDGGVLMPVPPLVGTAALEEPAPPPASDEPKQLSKIYLRDGQMLSGTIVGHPGGRGVLLLIGGGSMISIPGDAIERVEADTSSYRTPSGEIWFRDANRTRYLYAPSAMMLKRNELFFAQTELLLSGLNWGITDFLSLQVAGAVPIWFIQPPQGFNLVLGLKAGGSITEHFHLAAGAQMLWVPGLAVGPQSSVPIVGLAFGTATIGTPDVHASLSAGVPFSGINGLSSGSPIITLSGNVRVARSFAVVTEHWFIVALGQGQSHLLIANGLVGRIMGEKLAVDVGFVLVWADGKLVVPVPIPWLNFVYNFG